MKFADLFAGIGGFHYALKSINKNATPVLVSEIDPHAIKSYANNHKYPENRIKNIRFYTENGEVGMKSLQQVDDFDILMGGFPCQAFSTAGNKKGFLDTTRGTLFFDVAKMLEIKKPKYFLLENVKHLATHDNGKTWITIRETLKELGYLVPEQPILLSPDEMGVAMQIRHRVFIPGILSSKTDLKEFPKENFKFDKVEKHKVKRIAFDQNIDPETIIKDPKILQALEAWGEFIKNVERPFGRTLPVVWLDYMNNKKVDFKGMPDWKIKYIRDMKTLYDDNKEFIDAWMEKHKTDKWQKRERKLEWQAGKDARDYKKTFVQLRQSGFRFKKQDVFPTLVAMVQTSLFFDTKINGWRYLSRNEVRQLQSFPKTFKFDSVNSYQTYKQFGNSVNVEVVKAVLNKLLSL